MHIDEAEQRRQKLARANAALAGLATVESVESVGPALGYRNRTQLIVWRTAEGAIRMGSRVRGGEGLARMDGCRIVTPAIRELSDAIPALLEATSAPIWPEPDGLRWVLLRSDRDGQVDVEWVGGGDSPRPFAGVTAALTGRSGVASVAWSSNPDEGNRVRSGGATVLTGRSAASIRLGEVDLVAGPEAFLQLHHDVADAMYVAASATVAGDGAVWDLYAGLGGLGLNACVRGDRQLYAAESTAAAIPALERAAAAHGVTCSAHAVDLRHGIPSGWPPPVHVLVDPPRKGLSAAVRTRLAEVRAPVTYMSCDPTTLARDLEAWRAAGGRVVRVRAWDMFPQTPHLELLAEVTFDAPTTLSDAPLIA